jgi:hypothetical protein
VPAAIELLVDMPVEWTSLAAERRDRRAKCRAAVAYASQLPLFGTKPILGPLIHRRIALYEALRGGESVAWLD